ncbi:MAG: phenylacetate--CoA ligase family protein, partial [Myroides sp.]
MIPDIETQSITDIENFQNALLQKHMAYLTARSPFYQRKFKVENIQIDTIKTIQDLQKISVTTKADLQLHNQDFFCVDKTEIRDYATTSGTL